MLVTNTLVKLTETPVVETGDDIAIKGASGDLGVFAKHPDMPKYRTISMEVYAPDPLLEQMCVGGTVLSSAAAALGTPTGTAVVGQTTLGTLAAGTYGYRATQYNAFGESTAQAEVTVTNTGSTSTNVISGTVMAAGALGTRIYGRLRGQEQFMGSYLNIGTQVTGAASGTGAVTSLTVAAGGLTVSIPSGFTFTLSGDTNTPLIVFTTTAFSGIGAASIPVTASQTVTTTIATAANLVPCFVDSGSIVPGTSGASFPTTDTTAGPGTGTGYAAPNMGIVGNPNGISIEAWAKRIRGGTQATDWPYWYYVWPKVTGMHTMPRDFTNANLQTILEGQAYSSTTWGSGPGLTWPFASTQVSQRMACSALIVPTASFAYGTQLA
jgi:hypothetical protein